MAVEIEVKPLYDHAKKIEARIKKLRKQARPAIREPVPGMYR